LRERREVEENPMENLPYKCLVLVCINDRHGARKSCADGDNKEVRARLKEAVKEKGWSPKHVRVSSSMCLGLCPHGPNVVIYPQERWFSGVKLDDVDRILAEIEGFLEEMQSAP